MSAKTAMARTPAAQGASAFSAIARALIAAKTATIQIDPPACRQRSGIGFEAWRAPLFRPSMAGERCATK